MKIHGQPLIQLLNCSNGGFIFFCTQVREKKKKGIPVSAGEVTVWNAQQVEQVKGTEKLWQNIIFLKFIFHF